MKEEKNYGKFKYEYDKLSVSVHSIIIKATGQMYY